VETLKGKAEGERKERRQLSLENNTLGKQITRHGENSFSGSARLQGLFLFV
jgi:hypothetical protein